MRSPYTMSPRLHLPIHHWRANRNRTGKLLPGHRPARHLLRSCPLPLCPINRSSLCNPGRFHTLIPSIYRIYPSLNMSQSPLRSNIRRREPNLLPPTLPRPSRYTTTILRLPRRLHTMKCHLLRRLTNLPNSRNYASLHHLRSLRIKT